MYKVIVDEKVVFEGDIKFFNGGGTKSVYNLVGTDKVVLLPNFVDGQWLINEFDRIRKEELEMYKYLQSISILSLKIELCDIISNKDGKIIKGIYSPSFESYMSQGLYIYDTKNYLTTYWKNEYNQNNNITNIYTWIPIFQPLFNDFKILLQNGIMPYGDNLNFVVISSDKYKHTVRYFGFDFSSKRYVNTKIEKIKNGEKLDNLYSQENIRKLMVSALYYFVDHLLINDIVELLLKQD
jgi:hypothetical protein